MTDPPRRRPATETSLAHPRPLADLESAAGGPSDDRGAHPGDLAEKRNSIAEAQHSSTTARPSYP